MPEGTIYTCPMHPEIRQVGPGACPICGMALEPLDVDRRGRPNPELVDMTRRFWIGLALAVPVFVLEMGGHLRRRCTHLISQRTSNWVQLAARDAGRALGRLAVLRARLARRCVTRNLNMFTLIAHGHRRRLGSTASSRRWRPALFPAALPRATTARSPVYFEAAAVITVLVLLGQVLELRAREQTSGAIRALLDLAPKTARRIAADGATRRSPLDAGRGRRPPARAARREGAGRRRGASRAAARSTSRW